MHTSHPFLKKKTKATNAWQYFKNSILIGNISKTQFALTILKAQTSYLALFCKKTQSYQYLAKYYIISISLKVQ